MRLTVCGMVLLLAAPLAAKDKVVPTPTQIFNQRIMPIFRSPEPSSCIQCHLAAVDLKKYILPSHEKTFVSLRDQGLINLDDPEKSKILELIRMGEKDRDEGARLIHEKNRKAELAAFSAWIKACCDNPQLRTLPKLDVSELATPERPDEVIRHARKSRVVDSFVRNVWSQRMRCFPCHTPYELNSKEPRHRGAIKKQKEFEQQYPSLVSRLKIFRKSPEETLQYLIEQSQKATPGELPMINLDDPRNSLLVQKPMSKLPPKNPDGKFPIPGRKQPLVHLGGLKMHLNDHSYKSFVAWLQDYANVVGDEYASVGQLPADNWVASQFILRLTGAPDSWKQATPVQIFLHSWNADQQKWNQEPMAFTQGTVTPRHIVNGAIFFLTSGAGQQRQHARFIKPGRYALKVYVDKQNTLQKTPWALLTESDFVGQTELNVNRWRTGFRQAKAVSAQSLTKEN